MKQTAELQRYPHGSATDRTSSDESVCDNLVELYPRQRGRESLGENFCEEIDRWARRALAANGFGDY